MKTGPFGKSLDTILSCLFQSKQANGKLNIVTTFYPVYEFTKQVAGDTANVELLIGAGTEPHDYEPSPKAVAKIQDADAFVCMRTKTWKLGFPNC